MFLRRKNFGDFFREIYQLFAILLIRQLYWYLWSYFDAERKRGVLIYDIYRIRRTELVEMRMQSCEEWKYSSKFLKIFDEPIEIYSPHSFF